jgi:hypothetical protein
VTDVSIEEAYDELMNSLAQSESESGSGKESSFGTSPADFNTVRNKEWWDKLQKQLQNEAEKQMLPSEDDAPDQGLRTIFLINICSQDKSFTSTSDG